MIRSLLLLFIFSFTISCNNDNDLPDNPEYSEYITNRAIESAIHFMPEETYNNPDGPQNPSLKLRIVTADQLPCVNYSLATTEFIRENELIVRFDEILEPTVCLTAIGPAISYVDLPQNITKLSLLNGSEVDQYAIEVNPEKVTITPITNSFTTSLHSKTFRIPENSFAFVCGTNTDNTLIYRDFAAILEENPDFTSFTFEGDGRIPFPLASDGNWVNHPSLFFTYSNTSAFNNLADTLNSFAATRLKENDGVTISILGWNGINYYSWVDN